MLILVDVDGVLADCVGAVCKGLHERWGYRRSPEDVKHWNFAKSFSVGEAAVCEEIMRTSGFARDLKWYPGARSFVELLSGAGSVHAVTAPFKGSPTWMHERINWLRDAIHPDRVHFTSGQYKHMIRGDVLVEDHPGNAYSWLEANRMGYALLIDRPWNSEDADEYRPHARMIRVTSFRQALSFVRGFAS